MQTIRVLLIEDDVELMRRLGKAFEEAGFIVDRAEDGDAGWYLGKTENYDAVILDLGLPKLSGLEVLKRWRAESRRMPVLILTARDAWTERVDGLNAGADDYVGKPFQMPEVLARVRALIRRASGQCGPSLQLGDIAFDPAAGAVTVGGKAIELTARELQTLEYLMRRRGRIVSQSELAEHLYPLGVARDSNTVEVFVARLRKKLGRDVIRTIRGLGYRMG